MINNCPPPLAQWRTASVAIWTQGYNLPTFGIDKL